jgi:hypothetical protein
MADSRDKEVAKWNDLFKIFNVLSQTLRLDEIIRYWKTNFVCHLRFNRNKKIYESDFLLLKILYVLVLLK